MKKFLLLPIGALILSACSNEKIIDNQQSSLGDENVARSFLSVSLISPSFSTRANDYENGTSSENNINSVRFFFFDNDGNPAEVFKQSATDSYLSYIDWTPTNGDMTTGEPGENGSIVEGGTIEKIATATLGINMPAGNEYPTLVLAIINPVGNINQEFTNNPNLDYIRSIVADYYTGLTSNNFVMSNSVYLDKVLDNGTQKQVKIDATPIAANCFQPTAEEASQKVNQLTIYVERVLARLDLSISIPNPIPLKDKNENEYYIYSVNDNEYSIIDENAGVNPQKIYVKFRGWNVTSTPNKSRLIKDISADWAEALFGENILWNTDNYHRSFWAINPSESDFDYLYGDYNNTNNNENDVNFAPALGNKMPAPNDYVTTYMQENAAIYSTENNGIGPKNASKVILGAQLVNVDGTPLTLLHWANRYYTEQGLKNAVANSLNLYQQTANGTGFTKITPNYLEFVSANEIYGDELPDDVAQYYVYAQLTEDAEKITWYNGNTTESTAFTTALANSYILNRINYILMWDNGQTYYYFNIRHLGAKGNPGYDGVVRNHIYKANVTSIKGLGTPVYEPDEIIYPEVPDYDDSVLSAVIQVLQWRIVSQDYDIVWP